MHKRYVSIACVLLGFLSIVGLTGCSENIFKGLDGDTSYKTASEAMDNEDYAGALAMAQSTIDNPSASNAKKQEAYALKGAALLGLNKIFLINTSLELQNMTATSNVVETLSSLFAITPSASAEIADAFNMAYELGGGSLTSTLASTASTLSKDHQLLRGMANLSVAVKMTSRVLTIASNGTVNLAGDTASYAEALTYLMSGNKTVFYYAEHAIDGFTAANAFSNHQLEQANKVRIIGLNTSNLYTAYEDDATFTLQTYTDGTATDVTGDNAFTNDPSSETNLEEALNSIFSYIIN